MEAFVALRKLPLLMDMDATTGSEAYHSGDRAVAVIVAPVGFDGAEEVCTTQKVG